MTTIQKYLILVLLQKSSAEFCNTRSLCWKIPKIEQFVVFLSDNQDKNKDELRKTILKNGNLEAKMNAVLEKLEKQNKKIETLEARMKELENISTIQPNIIKGPRQGWAWDDHLGRLPIPSLGDGIYPFFSF